MSDKRLIDGTALLAELSNKYDDYEFHYEVQFMIAYLAQSIQDGKFDITTEDKDIAIPGLEGVEEQKVRDTWSHDCREVDDHYGAQVCKKGEACPLCGDTED